MTAAPVESSSVRPQAEPRGRRRRLLALALAASIALAAAVLAALPVDTEERVRPDFSEGAQVSDSPWGSAEVFGVHGSRILDYDHGTSVEMRIPWTGESVVEARLGDEAVHLLTVTDTVRDDDELVLTLLRDNCSYFHERAIDMFAGIDLTLASGTTTEVLFDRPLFVKSPMLAGCPDRTLDRQDDVRSEQTG